MKSIIDMLLSVSKTVVIGITVVVCTLLIMMGIIFGLAIG